jgi:hypothetical protein
VMEKVLPETPQEEFKKPESPSAGQIESGDGGRRAANGSGNGAHAASRKGKEPRPVSPAPGAGQGEVTRQ